MVFRAAAIVLALAPATLMAQTRSTVEAARYEACLERIKDNPEIAYEDGLIWRSDGGRAPARHCIALALLAMGEEQEAAERLETLARAPDAGPDGLRAEMLSQAGNVWLLDFTGAAARDAFSRGLEFAPNDADLLIDRARAHALLENWTASEADLNRALAQRPNNVLALTLRADARLQQAELDAAEGDIERALQIAPDSVEALLIRGHIREARRLGGR